jgi:dTDP-4-dehydrorhamnose reductase
MIYITGANGQLGQEFKKTALGKSATFLDRSQLDLSNLSQVESFLKNNKISTLINTAAYTQVDKAEVESDLALKVNAEAPALMARYASEKKFKLVHYSTDYVFNGENFKPYTESDLTNPINFYGSTKLQAEIEILKVCPEALILRTSWVYSALGKNFFNTMIRLANERSELKVVFDQIGSPTSTIDLADVTLKSLDQNLVGIFHFSNEGIASWYDFAIEILRGKNLKTPVYPIHTSEFPTPAKRPYYSVLDKAKIKSALNLAMPHWKESLEKVVGTF